MDILVRVILPVVERVMEEAFVKLPDEKRSGGYFCLYDKWSMPTPILVSLIGEVPDTSERIKYFKLAQEKAARLHQYGHHTSSWQSRDPKKNQWGGAIAAEHYYLAFSGLSELADETTVLLTALRLNLLSRARAVLIANISNNQIFLDKGWLLRDMLMQT